MFIRDITRVDEWTNNQRSSGFYIIAVADGGQRFSFQDHQPRPGMAFLTSISNDGSLRGALPPLLSQTNGCGAEQSTRTRKASVVNTKTIDFATSSLKSSSHL